MTTTNKIHLVGSIGLHDAEEVFRTLAEQVGDRAKRYPDGETGVRTMWLVWQYQVFTENPHLEIVADDTGRVSRQPSLDHQAG